MDITRKIEGFDNYLVNTRGQILSLKGDKILILKQRNHKEGYGRVALRNKEGVKYLLVHRLVALTFIPNPENKLQVNHINGNKMDNRVENLEWATRSENQKHSYSVLNKKPTYKKVIRIKDNEEKIYNSLKEASIELNCHRTGITNCLTGKAKTCKGYKWKYFKE